MNRTILLFFLLSPLRLLASDTQCCAYWIEQLGKLEYWTEIYNCNADQVLRLDGPFGLEKFRSAMRDKLRETIDRMAEGE